MAHYLIIGQGKIGVAVTHKLINQLTNKLTHKEANQQNVKVTAMARQDRDCYDLPASVDFLQQDARYVTSEQLMSFSHIAIIVTPSERGEKGYQDSYLAIAQNIATLAPELVNLQRLVFISSTGIYGQDKGEWIDIHTQPTEPKRVTSAIIYQAEQVLQQAFINQCVIIRPSGIYGVNRLMRIRQAKEADKPAMAEQAWTNRIMDTDLVNIIVQVLSIDNPQPIYLATDYHPVSSFELTRWLAQELHSTLPSINSELSTSGKRLHSNVPLAWLQYPDWQSGYKMILTHLS